MSNPAMLMPAALTFSNVPGEGRYMRTLAFTLILCLCALPLFAQSQIAPEFGSFTELKDKKTVYVLSEDLEARKVIVRELENYIQKGKVDLELVGTPEAEIYILYGGGTTRTTYKDTQQVGELAVSIRGAEVPSPDNQKIYRHRIVYSTRSSRAFSSGITFQRAPEKKAIRKFLDELSKLQKQK